jgi:hypothetical protein
MDCQQVLATAERCQERRDVLSTGIGYCRAVSIEKGWIVNRYWLLLSGVKGEWMDCQQVLAAAERCQERRDGLSTGIGYC